ncbi:alpha/beta fold hydrolase, partial [Thermodesulfobacteriota bacterium]
MGAVSLVLLPGLDGTGDLFDPLIECLPEQIKPVVVSYPKDKSCGYRDLKAIVTNALPRNTDYVILGESFSGPLAIMVAAERPAGLQGVILCASFLKNPFRRVPSWMSRLSVSPIYRLWPVTIQLRAILGRRKEKELADMALKAVRSVEPAVVSERVKSILSV